MTDKDMELLLPTTESGSININDVIAAIETADPTFEMMPGAAMHSRSSSQTNSVPYVEIIEQPASKALRFRYECEGRSAGSIPGANSTPENKTFPTIRIHNYRGRVLVLVSCVTKDLPYRPHPHNLVGKDVCNRGICKLEVPVETMTLSFDKLGIQCVKRKEIETNLRIRQEQQIDPFGTGYDHIRQPTTIDLNSVRLCFQAFIEGQEKGKFRVPLKPVVSDPIYDKKAMSDLMICKLSHYTASVAGGTEMVLLCEKVAKEDIQVRFFEERDGYVCWEGLGDFQPTQVHKQVAISFRTPSYATQQVEKPVQVHIQLRRPSDGATSDSLPFELLPLGQEDPDCLRRKRQKFNNSPNAYLMKYVPPDAEKHRDLVNSMHQYNPNIIKPEPVDRLSPFAGPSGLGTTPPMIQVENRNISPSNLNMLRPIKTYERTASPMDDVFSLIPAEHQQNLACQLQPIMPQNSPSPNVISNANAEPIRNTQGGFVQQNNLLDNNVLSNVIGHAMNPDGLENAQSNANAGMNFTQLENFDFTGLNISDYYRETANGIEATNTDETGMTDSFTRLTKKTIDELSTLTDQYGPGGDDMN